MKRTRHTPEQIIRKLWEADAMLSAGKTIGQAVQALQQFRPLTVPRRAGARTLHGWRA